MTHPFMVARTRKAATPAGDYQRRSGQYMPPEQSLQSRTAAEKFMGDFDRFGEAVARRGLPRDPSQAAPPFGRRLALPKSAAQVAAKTMVRSLVRATPVGRIWDLAKLGYELYQMAAAEIGPVPNFGANWALQFTCSQPLYNLKPYLVHRHLPGGCLAGFPPVPFSPIRIGVHMPIPASWVGLGYDKIRAPGGGFGERAAVLADWVRVAPGVSTAVIVTPAYWPSPFDYMTPWPTPRALPYPAVAPELQPIKAPAAVPQALPFRWLPQWMPSPMAVPGEAPARGPNREKSPWRAFDPVGVPAIAPVGAATPAKAGAGGGVAVEVDAKGARLIPSEHSYSSKEKRREIKIRSLRATVALALINQVTEGADYIDAVWESLPKNKQRLAKHRGLRIMRPQHKLEVIAANWRHLSMFEVARELFENEVVDRFFGKASQGLKGLNRQMGRPVGVEAGGALGGGKSSVTGEKGPSPWKDWTEHIVPKTN